MIGRGPSARTDAGETGGIALTAGLRMSSDGGWIPMPLMPPSADFEALSEGASARRRLFSYVLRLADAHRGTSERARVLLANYSHVCRELGIEWQS